MKKLLIIIGTIFVLTLSISTLKLNSKSFNYEYTYQDGIYEEQKVIDNNTLLSLILVVEDGKITYLDLDRTTKSNIFKISNDDKIYYLNEGLTDKVQSTYRLLVDLNQYDSCTIDRDKLITETDLVKGLDPRISDLKELTSYVTLQVVDESYKKDVDTLSEFVIAHNGINSLSLTSDYEILNFDTTYDLTEEIVIVKDKLNEIKIDYASQVIDYEKTTSNAQGLYMPGNYTKVIPNFKDDECYFNLIKYHVNDKGVITYFMIDEVINHNGLYTYRSSLDETFKEEMANIAKQVLINQSMQSFPLVDLEGNLVTEPIKAQDLRFKYLETSENVKYLYLGISAALKDTYQELDLVPGVHYTSVDNMMMSIVVDENKEIVNMTIDETFKWDTATVVIDGTAYLIYTFIDAEYTEKARDKYAYELKEIEGFVIPAFEEDGEKNFTTSKKVIYGDGTNFFYPSGVPVVFDATCIDEKNTLISVYGNLTKQNSVIYNNINDVDYHEDTEKLIEYFLTSNDPYTLNILSDGTTDTLDVSIPVANYQNLFASSLLEACSKDNIFNDVNEKNKDVADKMDIPDGRYYQMGSFSSIDEGFYIITVTVKDGFVESVIIDETYDNYGVLTTKNALKNDYYFNQEEEDSKRVDFTSYYQVSKELSNYLYQNNIIEKAFNSVKYYNYEDTSKNVDVTFSTGIGEHNAYLANYASAVENIINEMLKTKFTNRVNEIDELIREKADNGYILAKEDYDDGYLDLSDYLLLGFDAEEEYVIDLKVSSDNPTVLRVKFDDGELNREEKEVEQESNDGIIPPATETVVTLTDAKLTFDIDDDLTSGVIVPVTITYIMGDEEITKTYNFRVVPEKSFYYNILNSDELVFHHDVDELTKVDAKSNLNVLENESVTLYTNLLALIAKKTITYVDNNGNNLDFENYVNSELTVSDGKWHITDNFTKEDNEFAITFYKDVSKTNPVYTKTFEVEVFDEGDLRRANSNYYPGLLPNKIFNGTYDFSLGKDRLVDVAGVTYELKYGDINLFDDSNNLQEFKFTEDELIEIIFNVKKGSENIYSTNYFYRIVTDLTNFETVYEMFAPIDEESTLDFSMFFEDHNWIYQGEEISNFPDIMIKAKETKLVELSYESEESGKIIYRIYLANETSNDLRIHA